MEKWKGFQKGVNLGGWLSQCSMKKEHLEFFIGESDIRKISEWGCDHVRLPFDYEILQDEDGNLKPDAFLYIDRRATFFPREQSKIIFFTTKKLSCSF
jgi:aryl-phospho-beta-D-glucosidase BglC (GH1 family)